MFANSRYFSLSNNYVIKYVLFKLLNFTKPNAVVEALLLIVIWIL